ncbi:MAG: DUF6477 family protein [Paracoccaceae bacterium]
MTDLFAMLDRLRRPRLLIQAARAGCADYRREPHLRRLFGPSPVPRTGAALIRLIEMEDMLDQQRRQGDGGYSLVAHVDVLIAMMGEARLLRLAQSQAKAPRPVA